VTDVSPRVTPAARPDPALEEKVERAWGQVDADRLRELAVAVTSIPSPTGGERPLAEYLAEEVRRTGAVATVMGLDETQANAAGRLRGDGTGADLLLYAPIDTLTVGSADEDVPWIGPELRPDMQPVGRVDGPHVTGLGASNPKGHAACVLGALEAVAAAGIPLRGDLLVGFGAGGMPTNGWRPGGRRNVGHGVGCSYLVEQGYWPDYAVIAKPGWTVSWEEVGLAWFEVRVSGTHTYVGSRHRLPFRDPIVDAAEVIGDIERWFAEYTARHTEATVAPQGIVAAIDGGWRRMAAVTPAVCRFLIDLRLSPRTTPAQARREFAAAVEAIRRRRPGTAIEWDLVVAIPGTVTDVDSFVVQAATEAWERVEGRAHEVITGNSGATDANILRSRGIPTVRVGMPKVSGIGEEVDFQRGMNTVDVREMVRLTRTLVRTAINICGRPAADAGVAV
jgi:acetylornithine deacetylase/succinyl-diaminopimelate desuccinylase-like protein